MDSTANRAICLVTVPFVFVFSMLAQSASAQETAKGLLAIQAHAQGYKWRQADQCKTRRKTIATGPSVLGSALRAQFLHDEAIAGHGRAYSAPEVGQSLTRSASLVCQ